ncbi:MAG: hypothetical protein ACTSQZ_05715, partial [Candidatus Thorarchaeota archaeon]
LITNRFTFLKLKRFAKKLSTYKSSKPKIRKAIFIVHLWADGEPLDENSWHGTAEHIDSSQSHKL